MIEVLLIMVFFLLACIYSELVSIKTWLKEVCSILTRCEYIERGKKF